MSQRNIQRDDLVIYQDKELKHQFVIQELGDFEPGEALSQVGYLSNNSRNEITEIDYDTTDPDLILEDVPDKLKAGEWRKITVVYSPPIDRTTDLNTSVSVFAKKRGGD